MQKKLYEGKLLNEKGALSQAGYATSLIKEYDVNDIKAKKSRIKEWDYYLIYNVKYALALTIDDNRYMGLLSASLINFEVPEETTKSIITLFTNGKTNMPKTSKKGNVEVENNNGTYKFLNNGKTRELIVEHKNFENNNTLKAHIILEKEPTESMVIATPFAKKTKAFYYNQKIIGFVANGTVEIGDKKIEFNKTNTYGLLDWGRGVWTYKNTWLWSAATGVVNGKTFGFNLGYGFGDTSAASENMLFYNGYAHKLDQVTFNIPQDEKGKYEYTKPWTFTSNDNRVNLTFEPIIDRKAKTNLLILLSDQHQVFGRFSGTVVLDDKKELKLDKFLGFAERVTNKW